MAVLGSSIPIASFYCRKQHIFCCCGDITPKFGDFNSIPLPTPVADLQFKADILFPNHDSRILRQSSSMWFIEEPSQFSVGQKAQSLTCSFMDEPITGLDDCLRILLRSFRIKMSDSRML